jgi:SSS family solute:Na+ symporter
MIAIVIMGLFTRQVPAIAAKVVIVFHILAYGTFQFVLKDLLPVHFLHLYAILFVLEVGIMLAIGVWRPRREETVIRQSAEVDLTPWSYAQPCAVTLLSCVVALYLVFSPVGLVGDGSSLFVPVLLGLLALNMAFWFGWHRRMAAESGVRA